MNAKDFTPVFYVCPICGNIIEVVENSGNVPSCCGRPMLRLVAGTSDGAAEKHVPVYEIFKNQLFVQVGSSLHPMTPDHHINWIEIITDQGIQRKNIADNEEPAATFHLDEDEELIAIYAYCNLHELWCHQIK